MEIKKGIGVSPGVVISTAIVLDAEDLVIPKRTVPADQIQNEVSRFNTAIETSSANLAVLRDQISEKYGKEIGGIFDFHLGILKDRTILRQVQTEISNQKATAEYAVSSVIRKYANTFLAMSDRY